MPTNRHESNVIVPKIKNHGLEVDSYN